eukprot:6372177-Amphidinium_carterae.1
MQAAFRKETRKTIVKQGAGKLWVGTKVLGPYLKYESCHSSLTRCSSCTWPWMSRRFTRKHVPEPESYADLAW